MLIRGKVIIGVWILQIFTIHLIVAQTDSTALLRLKAAKELIDQRAYDSAYIVAAEAVREAEELKDSITLVDALQSQGLARHFEHRIDEVRPLYERALAIGEKVLPGDSRVLGRLYNNMGAINTDQGKRQAARQFLEKGLALNQRIPDNASTIAINHYNLGLSCMYFQENREALDHFLAALPSYLEEYGENGSRVAQLYNNVGLLYSDDGDYDKALDYFQRSIDIHLFNHDSNYWNLAYPYTTMASSLNSQKAYDEALNYYTRALRITQQNPMSRLEGIIHSALAIHYVRIEQFELAHENIDKGINIFLETYGGEHPRLGDFYRIKARIYRRSGNRETAQIWYQKSIDQIRQNYGEYHPKISSSFLELASDAREAKDYDQAIGFLNDAETYFMAPIENEALSDTTGSAIYNHKYLFTITLRRAIIYNEKYDRDKSQSDLERAFSLFTDATELATQIRRQYQSESAKLFLQQNASIAYEGGAKASLALLGMTGEDQYLDHLFYFLEKNQASILSEALRYNQLDKFRDVPDVVISQEKQFAQSIKELQIKIENAPKSENDSLLHSYTLELFDRQRSADSLNNVIEKKYPAYHQLKYGSSEVTLSDLQSAINDRDLIISFMDTEDQILALSIGKNETQAFEIDSASRSILLGLREKLAKSGSEIENLKNDLREAYDVTLSRPLARSEGIERLIILPNGIFSHLPIGAFIETDEVDGDHWLIENYSILYAPSGTLLIEEPKNQDISTTYVGFAPNYVEISEETATFTLRSGLKKHFSNLQGAEEEVLFAKNLFNGRAYIGREATESALKNMVETFHVLHLAMHADIDDTDPAQSRLYFTPEDSISEEDGYLKAFEIYNMRLNGELVVLSACNTGDGTLSKGEGILSLSRAFRYAGCPNILMSLWRANDVTTKEIIKEFFLRLKAGEEKDEALRQAKLSFLKSADPLMAHPSNWSTLQLQGDLSTIHIGKDSLRSKVLLLVGIVLAGLFLIPLTRKRASSPAAI